MLISYEQALKIMLKNIYSLPVEYIPVEDSISSVLAQNIISKIDMPPFNKSAVDGYALRHSDTRRARVRLRCIGLIQAGDIFRAKICRDECVKIMTGAQLPKDTDSVVMVENVRISGSYIEVQRPVRKGENVCFKGEDIMRRQSVLKKGKIISASDVALLATVGRRFVKVLRKPNVAILNTGGEIVPLGAKLGRNRIYNSNGPMLEALLKTDNIRPRALGIVKDDASQLIKAVISGLKSDILLISGGVSMGDYDLIPAVLKTAGIRKIFHKVKIKPGKPILFGIKNKTIVFGIPGNPVSNFLSYLIFIRPAIRKMMGYSDCGPQFKQGIVDKGFKNIGGRKHFVLARISRKSAFSHLSSLHGHGSADTLSLSKADGFMVVYEGIMFVKSKAKVPFITWKTT